MNIIVKKYHEVDSNFIDDGINVSQVDKRVVIGPEDGANNFYMRVFTLGPGGFSPKHTHTWEHEVFVINGKGVVYTENGDIEVDSGSVVFVPPNVLHQFRNVSNEAFEFICIIPSNGN